MKNRDLSRIGLALAAPLLAVAFSVVVTSVILLAAGDPVWVTWKTLVTGGLPGVMPRNLMTTINLGTTYYLSAIAVAIGFRMNLFNIGVDGQYRLAVFAAAVVGGAINLPKPLHILVVIVVAMAVGAAWAAIAGLLKVGRGVSEVISTIMLNAIAGGLVAYLLRRVASGEAASNNISTPSIPESGRMPGFTLLPNAPVKAYGFVIVAALVGVGYWYLISRTRFGFDLRATGRSATAAVASGVNVKRMIVASMVLSGAVAGLVGLPELLGKTYTYDLSFPAGLGFTGIAIALVGRNSPVGVAVAALLFAYLDVASNPLQILADVAPEVVKIMQGIIVLSVVIAYEMVRRYSVVAEQRKVARELGDHESSPPRPGGTAQEVTV
ncbi:ABC transporter permease [Angustibacter sp. Root456]|uniref:ABC transporter permease n=1 Tax=Angustibacter sp. Root456 TaxID=1736539 RepID=UPI0006F98883|nr:ABC transporter permease [Angustibacter sp. Root456]KQX69993.1 sugar ABC transporter permease [Angustibacter sp. Root456]